ncbi:MAG: FliM/FliN family flagellar motor switch protein, partial [Pseudomonadota bacterium]
RPDLSDFDDAVEDTGPAEPKPLRDLDAAPRIEDSALSTQLRTVSAMASLGLYDAVGAPAALSVVDVGWSDLPSAAKRLKPGGACVFFGRDRAALAVLTLHPDAVSGLIASAFGAAGDEPLRQSLTRLEAAVLKAFMAPIADALPGDLEVLRIEGDPEFAAALASPGRAAFADLSVRVAGDAADAALAILESALDISTTDAADGKGRPADMPRAQALVTARIASLNVPVSRLADLKPGSTLKLGLPANHPVELLSGGRRGDAFAEGDVGRRGGRIAVRVARRFKISG